MCCSSSHFLVYVFKGLLVALRAFSGPVSAGLSHTEQGGMVSEWRPQAQQGQVIRSEVKWTLMREVAQFLFLVFCHFRAVIRMRAALQE